ncbi:MAG: DNA polymerase/3'-5' exonuclease PolX, partial [Dehalococcoidia bacterium]
MTNEELAQVFDNMAALLELKGESVFKIRAYQRAVRTIEQYPQSFAQLVREGQDLQKIPGIGEAISKKIAEAVTTGQVRAYEELKSEFPQGVLSLMNIPGVGPKTAYRLVQELSVGSVDALEQAILDGRVASLERLGEKTAENILRQIRSLRSKDKRIPIGRALPVAEEVMAALQERCPGVRQLSPAGSLRRWRETIGDIDIMGTADRAEEVIDTLVRLPMVEQVLVHGPKKASVVVSAGLQVDLRIVDAESFGALIQYFTGSKQHNILLRDYANRMGLSLNEYGITNVKTGEQERFAREEDFYARLGLQFIPPELREGLWEVERAQQGTLPRLVEVADIKGDLHVHSEWSDGRDSLEAMLSAARAMGHHYVAITDHSEGLGVARGLTPERLRQQREELRALEQRLGITVLQGSEVDIRADGSLDFPDEVLAELDLIVAAIHSSLNQEAQRITERTLQAMHHPYVTILAHPTSRLLGEREPTQIDMEAVFQAALETGTILEINASTSRMDLKDTHVLRARELGIPLVINTDSHSAGYLQNLRFGVAIARRGWCEPQHIVNALPREAFLRLIRAPKGERLNLWRQLQPVG